MGSIFGDHPRISTSRKGLSLPFTATGLTFFWTTILNTISQSHTHMLIPIGLPVSKQDALMVVHAYALPVVQLHIKRNYNQRLLVLWRRRNSCRHMIQERWYFSYTASSESWIYPRKQLLSFMKTMMHVRPWLMRKNQRRALATWTSSTLLLADGLNATLCYWSVLTAPSIYLIILWRAFRRTSFIDIQISYLVTFRQRIRQYTTPSLGHMPQMMTMLTRFFLVHSLPPLLQRWLEYMLHSQPITLDTHGLPLLSMGFTIHLLPCLVV